LFKQIVHFVQILMADPVYEILLLLVTYLPNKQECQSKIKNQLLVFNFTIRERYAHVLAYEKLLLLFRIREKGLFINCRYMKIWSIFWAPICSRCNWPLLTALEQWKTSRHRLLCFMHQISVCELLLKRNKIEPFLKKLITSDEKWITYDNNIRKRSWSKRNEVTNDCKAGLMPRWCCVSDRIGRESSTISHCCQTKQQLMRLKRSIQESDQIKRALSFIMPDHTTR